MGGGWFPPHMREVGGSSPSSPTSRTRPPRRSPRLSAPIGPCLLAEIGETFLSPSPRRGRDSHTQQGDHDEHACRRRPSPICSAFAAGPGASRLPVPLAHPRALELRALRRLLALARRADAPAGRGGGGRVPLPHAGGQPRPRREPRAAPRPLRPARPPHLLNAPLERHLGGGTTRPISISASRSCCWRCTRGSPASS